MKPLSFRTVLQLCLLISLATVSSASKPQAQQQPVLWSGFKQYQTENEIKSRFPAARWRETTHQRTSNTSIGEILTIRLDLDSRDLADLVGSQEPPIFVPTFIITKRPGSNGHLAAISLSIFDTTKNGSELAAWSHLELVKRFGGPFMEKTLTGSKGDIVLKLFRDKKSDRTVCLYYVPQTRSPTQWVQITSPNQLDLYGIETACGM